MERGSRTKNSIRNVKWAMVAYLLKFAVAFFFRMVFVRTLGNTYAGADGLFTTLLAVIALVELGYETTMAYLLYKPIAQNDREALCRIMRYYRKVSFGIGAATLALGLSVLPVLSQLVPNLPDLPDIRSIYLCILVNTVIENTFRYLRTFVRANQRQYVFTLAHYLSGTLMDGLQIVTVLLTRSYLVCLMLQGLGLALEFCIESRYISRNFGNVFADTGKKMQRTHRTVRPYLRSMALHHVGNTLLLQSDVLLVTGIGGMLQAGIYSNYKYILYALNSVYKLLMESVAAGVGELGARKDVERSKHVFGAIQLAGAWLYGMSAVCLFTLFNPFITLWLGKDSLFPMATVAAITVRFYVNGCKKAPEIYRDAFGLFIYDRYVPLIEAVLLLLFTGLLQMADMGVASVLWASVLASVCTSVWITPLQLHRKGFGSHDAAGYFLRYAAYTVCTALSCILTWYLANLPPWEGIGGFVWQMACSAVIPNLLFLLCFGRTAEGRLLLGKMLGMVDKRRKK